MNIGAIGSILNLAGSTEQAIAGGIGAYLSSKAMSGANKKAQQQMQNAYKQSMGYYDPYGQMGTQYLGQMSNDIQAGKYSMPDAQFQYGEQEPGYGQFNVQNYQAPEFNFKADPGYSFRMKSGQQAVEAGAASRGMQLSGATQKALAQYGQNLGSQEYGNAYGRYSNDRAFGANQFNTEQNLKYSNFSQNRDFQRERFTGNRDFAYDEFLNRYGRQQQNMMNRYNMNQDMVNLGYGANQQLSGLAERKGQTLADLMIQLGNIEGAKYTGIANAFINQGQAAKNI
jgi:hypothetical protein